MKTGCKGIIVSNHGARQLDTVPGTIEALPEIVEVAGKHLTIMIDGGIRNGNVRKQFFSFMRITVIYTFVGIDVFKALALGAKAVFIGRPVLHGLAVDGEKGVEDILTILKNEFDSAMALVGVTKISDIKPTHVAHESTYKLSKL